MFIFWQANNELARTPNGKRLQLTCLKCNQKSKFYECKVDEGVKLYFLVDIWKRTRRVLQCGECLAVCDYYDVFPDERDDKAKKQAAEAELKSKQEADAQAKRQQEAEDKRRAEEKRRKDAQVEDELAELKRRMGRS